MHIDDAIIKYYLRNVMFINGTAYAGKSTMVRMLADKYDLIHCGENYEISAVDVVKTPERYPNLCYFQTMSGWQEFINRTPEVYAKWADGVTDELAAFEIAELMSLSRDRKVIVDTNIPLDVLKKIAGYNQVAIMLSPQWMSVDKFFDRDDDKSFFLEKINEADDPEKTMANFRACIAEMNRPEQYDAFLNSGFYTIVRENADIDTREETLAKLAAHFGLE